MADRNQPQRRPIDEAAATPAAFSRCVTPTLTCANRNPTPSPHRERQQRQHDPAQPPSRWWTTLHPVAACRTSPSNFGVTGHATSVARRATQQRRLRPWPRASARQFHLARSPDTVTLTVTDNNGNASTVAATVTVEDKVNRGNARASPHLDALATPASPPLKSMTAAATPAIASMRVSRQLHLRQRGPNT